ncbi:MULTISPECIES: hypothetical protein [unclassified Caballeronia]|uniref:hypothetical protein n=1 Tax=unclassified Caballeronia TaxID=2646786 RepID=UPI00117CC075|nr:MULTISPECIES: hypothetical protein [unclassified Caballeronia]
MGEFIEYLLAWADARPRCAYIVARKKSHQPTICDNHMWKYDTGIRAEVQSDERSLAGQGFAGYEENDLAIFGVSRKYKSPCRFAIQAGREACVGRTKGKKTRVTREAWKKDASGRKAEAGELR